MNPRYRHFLVSNGRIFFIRLSTAMCWETFLRTFSVSLEFYFVAYGNTKHFQISSNGNSSFFAVEMWYYTCDFPITIAWYLEAFLFIPFCLYLLLTFARSAFITSSTFSAVLPAKKICISSAYADNVLCCLVCLFVILFI